MPLPAFDRFRTNALVRICVLAIAAFGASVLWLTPMQGSPIEKELVRGGGTLFALIAAYFVLFWRTDDPCVGWWAWLIVAGTAGTVGVMVSVHYLDRFPRLNLIDEVHNWVVQWTYANTGLMGDTLYKQMIPLPQPIYDGAHYILGASLRFFGDGFWQARFARLLMAYLALPFIYLCGVRMYGARAGLMAVVVAILFLPSTAYVRPDVFVGTMFAVALYVYLRAQTTRRPWMHYLAGLCVALAGEGHPLAYRFGVAFAMLYGIRWLWEMRTARRFLIDGRIIALALGGLTGMLIYLAIHIIPGWDQGLHFARNYTPASRTTTEQIDLGQRIIYQQLLVWINTSPVEFILLLLGISLALLDFNNGDRVLLAVLGVSQVLLIVSYGYYREFYQVHFVPVVALLIGRVLAYWTDRSTVRMRVGRVSGLALSSVVLTILCAVLLYRAQAASVDPIRDEFTRIAQQLKRDLPPEWVVVGNENYFMEIRSHNYYGIQTVTTDQWFMVLYEGYELWEVTNPDAFILSGSRLDWRRYTDMESITRYMADNGFRLARCYTGSGTIQARVYAREIPADWVQPPMCAAE
jgi:hypothetical protein